MNHDDFDKRFRSHSNLVGRGITAFGIVWLAWACVCLAGAAGLAYVAWHFVSKFW